MAQNKDFLCFKTRIKTRQTKQNKARQGQPSSIFQFAVVKLSSNCLRWRPYEFLCGIGRVGFFLKAQIEGLRPVYSYFSAFSKRKEMCEIK